MPHCMVPGCANGSRKTKGIFVSYYWLPNHEKMPKISLNRIRRDNPSQAKYAMFAACILRGNVSKAL